MSLCTFGEDKKSPTAYDTKIVTVGSKGLSTHPRRVRLACQKSMRCVGLIVIRTPRTECDCCLIPLCDLVQCCYPRFYPHARVGCGLELRLPKAEEDVDIHVVIHAPPMECNRRIPRPSVWPAPSVILAPAYSAAGLSGDAQRIAILAPHSECSALVDIPAFRAERDG